MSTVELVRAWKDEGYRLGLDAADQPAHPAGDLLAEIAIGDGDLDPLSGTTVSVIEDPFTLVSAAGGTGLSA